MQESCGLAFFIMIQALVIAFLSMFEEWFCWPHLGAPAERPPERSPTPEELVKQPKPVNNMPIGQQYKWR